MSTVAVELVGTLSSYVGRSRLTISMSGPATLLMLLTDLEDYGLQRNQLIEEYDSETRSKVLILVNGIEISVLNGLLTMLRGGDLVTLIPVSHGG